MTDPNRAAIQDDATKAADVAAQAKSLIDRGTSAVQEEAKKEREASDPNRVKPRPGETEESAKTRDLEAEKTGQRQPTVSEKAEAARTMGLVYVVRSLVGEYLVIEGREVKPWGLLEVRHSDVPEGVVQRFKKLQDERKVQVSIVHNAVTSEEVRFAAMVKEDLFLGDGTQGDHSRHSRHGDVRGTQMQAAAAGDTGARPSGDGPPKTIDGKKPADPHAAVGTPKQ